MQENCDLMKILRLFGKKYSLSLLYVLSKQPLRYNEIYKVTNRIINPTLLSARLKDMEDLGIISITEKDGKKYLLTDYGEKIKTTVNYLKTELKNDNKHIPEGCSHRNSRCLCEIMKRRR
ncbi:MAG: winged helix-turn-helix transcriptional regulator [Nanobdellota archaeon]